jgi:hypothetical protein
MRLLSFALVVAVVASAVVVAENFAVRAYFPHLSRLNTDFSDAYLQRELQGMAASPPQVIFLGDSVLWGFRLKAQQTAVALLSAKRCRCINLSFKSSSPPNYYALTKLLLHYGVRPQVVVLEIDQRVLNQANSAYRTLHPALAELAAPLLSSNDRKILGLSSKGDNFKDRLARLASAAFPVYAMRADLRETLAPPPDAVAPQHPTAAMFLGEYDLSPLTDANVGVRYLEKTADALRAARIPTVAFMTPTNHALLHDYIDGPEYRYNLIFLRHALERRGVSVVDLDRAFPAGDFYDYAHLKASAQTRLANILEKELPR